MDADFVAALLLYQHRQDNALGLHHVTAKQRGLLWYYNLALLDAYKESQLELFRAFHYGVVKGARKRIKQIRNSLNVNTPIDRARQLYQEALVLEETIKKSLEIVDG